MGVDLGLKIPAVAATDKSNIRFFGNGRENKYKKRMARAKKEDSRQGQEAESYQKARQ